MQIIKIGLYQVQQKYYKLYNNNKIKLNINLEDKSYSLNTRLKTNNISNYSLKNSINILI